MRNKEHATVSNFSSHRAVAAVCLAAALASAAQGATFQPAWRWLGPAPIPNGQTTTTPMAVSGRVTTIVVHPTNPAIAYVGTAQGGLYRTLDGGSNWTQLLDGAATLAVGALKLAPSDPTTLFVGTGEPYNNPDGHFGQGIYVITQADTNPVLAGPFNKNAANADVFAGNSISQILVSSSDPNTILVSTNQGQTGIGGQSSYTIAARGVFRSTNALSASPTFVALTNNVRVFDMSADASNLNTFVFATPNAIDRFDNALSGTSVVTSMFTPSAPFSLVRFAMNTVGSTSTYLAVTSEAQGGFGQDSKGNPITKQGTLRFATYNGSTWSAWSAPITAANGFADNQAFYDMGVAIDPTTVNNIYIGGTASDFYGVQSGSFKKSSDGGATFTASENGLHSDTHAIAVAPSNPSTIYFGSDGGIWKSTDTGSTWTSLSNISFSATQFQGIAIHPTNRDFLIGGTQDNGTNFLTAQGTWTQVAGGDGGACLIDQNATDTTNVTMYHTYYNLRKTQIGFDQRDSINDQWVFRGYSKTGTDPNGNPVYSTNGITGSDNVNFYAPMAQGPGNPNSIYFGTDRLYRSGDKGVTMTLVSQGPLDPTGTDPSVGSPISSISISPQNDAVRLIGLDSGKVFVTTNGSTTVTDVTGSIPAKYIGAVLIDPNNVDTAYVALAANGLTSGQQIWKTTNLSSGASWVASSTGIPDLPVNALVIDPADSNRVYAGTDDGVYASADRGGSWARFGTGFPHVAVWSLAFQNQNRYLRVGTHGRGIYEALPDAPHNPPDVAITSPSHQSLINSFSTIAGTALDRSGTGIAGNSINFTLFHVSSGQYWSGTNWSNTQVQISTAVDPNTNVWTFTGTLPNSSDGTLRGGQYALSASTHDNNGDNSVPQSGVNNITFTIDNSPPTVTISSPTQGSTLNDASFSFSGTANDDNTISRVVLFIRRNSDNTWWNGSTWVADSLQANLSSTYTSSDHSWVSNATLPAPGSTMANGSYNFQAKAFDNAGNFTFATADVTVDYHPQWTWTHGSLNDPNPANRNNRWDDPANWSPNGVPPGPAFVNISNDSVDASSIAHLTVYGLSLTNGAALTAPEVNLAAGGAMTWSYGYFSGTLNIPAGATAAFSGPGLKWLGNNSVINNYGTIVWSGPGIVQGFQNATFNNFASGVLQLTNDGTVFSNYYGGNTFNNIGKIEKLTATGSTLLTDWTYSSSGTIKTTTGTIEFPAGATLTNDSIISGGGRVRFSGGVLAINGNMHIDAGTFEITGTVSTSGTSALISTNGASIEWSGGTINGTINIDPSMVLLVDGAATKLVGNGATINNSGEMVWTGVGAIQGFQASTINNLSGSLFFVSNDAGLTNYYGGNVLNIAPGATFFKNASAAGTTQIDWSLNNNGLVRITQGALALTNDGSSAGTFQMFSGALLRVLGGTQTLATGTKFIGAGKTQLVGGAIVAAGNASSGTASSASILEISGGTLTTSGTGIFTPYGTLNWTGGTIGGQFHIPAGSALNLSGANTKLLDNGGDIENAGTINFTGTGFLQGFQNGTINNLANALFSIAGDGQVFANYYGGNVFNNAGTFIKASGAGTTVLTDWTFNNTGAINVASGSVEYDSTLNLNAGSTFVGAGLIRLAGTINVAASVSLTDQFVLAGGSFNSADANNPPKLASGNLTWSSGTINGTWNIAAGATLTISGPDVKPLGNGAILNNAGTILWSGAAIQGFQNVAINNQSGAAFTMSTDAGLLNYYSGNAFNNAAGATFTKTGTNGTGPIQWDVNNSGTWHVATGNLELYGGGLSAGNFITDSAAIVRIAGGNQSLGNNAFLQGGGKYQITGGALTVAGTNVKAGAPANLATVELMTGGTLGSSANALTVTGTFNWSGGSLTSLLLPAVSTMNVSGPDTKVLSNGGIIENNGTIKWSGGAPIQAFQSGTILNAIGATFDAKADGRPLDQTYSGNTFLNQGAFIKSGGTGVTTIDVWSFYSGSGGSIEAHSGNIAFSNDLHLNGGGTLLGFNPASNFITSNGNTSLIGTTVLNGVIFVFAGNSLSGDATAQLDAINGAQFQWTGGTLSGTLALSNRTPSFILGPDSKQFNFGAVLNNSGVLTLMAGSSLQGIQSVALNNLSGATLTIQKGAALVYVYGGNVLSNAGTLNLTNATGVLSLNGWGYTQTGTGTLNLRIAGALVFDALDFGEGANLSGAINVSLINNYLPNVGDTFPLLTYSSVSGSFSTVRSPGFDFNVIYNAGNFSLVAASQPTLADWKQGYFTDPNSAQASDTASPAGDGMANLLKYALGLNPTLPFTSSIPLTGLGTVAAAPGSAFTTDSLIAASSSKHPTFSFRRIDPVNVTYVVQASDNMADPNSWTEIARLNTGTTAWFGLASVTETGTGSTRQVTVTDSFTFQQKSKRFFRLLVSH